MFVYTFSSFLDVLAGRKDPAGIRGHLLLDGKPVPENFKCMVGYVVQVCLGHQDRVKATIVRVCLGHWEGLFGSLGRFVWVIGKVCLDHWEGSIGSLGRFVWVIVEVCLGHCEGLFGSL